MSTVESTWGQQAVWSSTANRLKKSIVQWRITVLSLSVGGAILETLAPQVDQRASNALAYAGAVVLALAPIIVARKLGREQTRAWIRARSASEGLKKAVYQFLMRVPPYDAASPETQLAAAASDIVSKVKDLAAEAALTTPTVKPLPSVGDEKSYITHRVTEQIDTYYRPKSRQLARRESQFRTLEFFLSLVAAGLGAAQAISGSAALGSWVAVLTTAGAAIAAHVAAERYQHLVIAYTSTALRLESLRDAWLASDRSAERLKELVQNAEEAISIENQGWMAAWAPTE